MKIEVVDQSQITKISYGTKHRITWENLLPNGTSKKSQLDNYELTHELVDLMDKLLPELVEYMQLGDAWEADGEVREITIKRNDGGEIIRVALVAKLIGEKFRAPREVKASLRVEDFSTALDDKVEKCCAEACRIISDQPMQLSIVGGNAA